METKNKPLTLNFHEVLRSCAVLFCLARLGRFATSLKLISFFQPYEMILKASLLLQLGCCEPVPAQSSRDVPPPSSSTLATICGLLSIQRGTIFPHSTQPLYVLPMPSRDLLSAIRPDVVSKFDIIESLRF